MNLDDSYDRMIRKPTSSVKFKEGIIQEIMKLHLSDPKTKVSNDCVLGMEQVVLSFVRELIWRITNQATNEGLTSVNVDHLEKILPQLIMDYS